MRKNFLKIIFSSLILFLSSEASADGCVFFNTVGDWQYGGIYVDGSWAGRIQNGFAFFCLPPGNHKISSFKKTSRSSYASYTTEINPNINVSVKENTLTSIGTIVLYQTYNTIKTLFLKSDDITLAYVKKFHPQHYKSFSGKEVLHAFVPYKNKYLTEIQNEYLREKTKSLSIRGPLAAGDLGILVDLRNNTSTSGKNDLSEPREISMLLKSKGSSDNLVNTGTMQRLSLALGEEPLERTVLLGRFNNLFSYDGKAFETIPTAEHHAPYLVAQTKNWLFTVDAQGNLSKTHDFGKIWHTIDTEISENDWVYTVGGFSNNKFIFGPLTHTNSDTTYKKRVGYIVDGDSAEIKEIKWSKYVTENSKFYTIGDTIYLDPVSLGKKAFLFYYHKKKNKWKEVKLPNRRCKIEGDSKHSAIKLNCQKGKSYIFSGIGTEWQMTSDK